MNPIDKQQSKEIVEKKDSLSLADENRRIETTTAKRQEDVRRMFETNPAVSTTLKTQMERLWVKIPTPEINIVKQQIDAHALFLDIKKQLDEAMQKELAAVDQAKELEMIASPEVAEIINQTQAELYPLRTDVLAAATNLHLDQWIMIDGRNIWTATITPNNKIIMPYLISA